MCGRRIAAESGRLHEKPVTSVRMREVSSSPHDILQALRGWDAIREDHGQNGGYGPYDMDPCWIRFFRLSCRYYSVFSR
jgi:hypothetical protein